ncbi:DDE Tnp4 domain-containing protein [Mycena venus]|uniref:DDE Tnp4 domain-containing protein n=1 Tax=Mycena venus TaxID=2733690 RepID=A0A8H6Y4B5_9AGAR|nr:DDE Tnp4 domain-containing protein [Mycena venus]
MPDLFPAGYLDLDEEDESDSDSSRSQSGEDRDDEEGWEDDMEDDLEDPTHGGSSTRWVRVTLEEMYAHHYEAPHNTFPHGPVFLRHVLGPIKDTHPDLFHQELRMSPYTFDKLMHRLAGDPVFANDSQNSQMPVEDQLAIALYQFKHSGNAASLQKVANWAGVGKGTSHSLPRIHE